MIVVERKHDNVVHRIGRNLLEGMNSNAMFLLCHNNISNFAPLRSNFGGLLSCTKFVICVFTNFSWNWSNFEVFVYVHYIFFEICLVRRSIPTIMVLAFNFMENSKNHKKRNGIVRPSLMGRQRKVDLAIIATPKQRSR